MAKRGPSIELARVIERGRTIRAITYTIGVVVSIGLIVYGAIEIAEVLQKPAWLQLTLAIAGPLISTPVFIVLLRSRAKYIEKTHRRLVELEKRLDPGRQSSKEQDG